LIFVAAPADTVRFGRSDNLQKEWQECRTAIGRLDSTLVDLRKYGFGLASGLLTAGGVLGRGKQVFWLTANDQRAIQVGSRSKSRPTTPLSTPFHILRTGLARITSQHPGHRGRCPPY
jgi:hypothetical protein